MPTGASCSPRPCSRLAAGRSPSRPPPARVRSLQSRAAQRSVCSASHSRAAPPLRGAVVGCGRCSRWRPRCWLAARQWWPERDAARFPHTLSRRARPCGRLQRSPACPLRGLPPRDGSLSARRLPVRSSAAPPRADAHRQRAAIAGPASAQPSLPAPHLNAAFAAAADLAAHPAIPGTPARRWSPSAAAPAHRPIGLPLPRRQERPRRARNDGPERQPHRTADKMTEVRRPGSFCPGWPPGATLRAPAGRGAAPPLA
jgi:hypothetical protein